MCTAFLKALRLEFIGFYVVIRSAKVGTTPYHLKKQLLLKVATRRPTFMVKAVNYGLYFKLFCNTDKLYL